MRKLILLLFLAFLNVNVFFAQNSSDQQAKFLNAENLVKTHFYIKATSIYDELIAANPGNNNLYFKRGYCSLHSQTRESLKNTITDLETAGKDVNLVNYAGNSINETKAPVEAYLYLAKAYRANSNFEKALENFHQYRSLKKNEDQVFYSYLDKEILYTKYLKSSITKHLEINLTRLEDLLKYPYKIDNFPVISSDGKTVVFTSGNNGNILKEGKLDPVNMNYDKIFYSKLIGDKWTDPVEISYYYNLDTKTKPVCISSDGKDLFIVVQDDKFKVIYVRHFVNGKWTSPVQLNNNINTGNVSHASISDDGKTLYFSCDRQGGFGGYDIFKSVKDSSGDWGKAVNLGNKINTKHDEDYPCFIESENMLFFSSKGHNSLGGYDLFYSDITKDDFSDPVNIGTPVSSYYDDLVMISKINDNIVFFPLSMNVVTKDSDCYIMRSPSTIERENVNLHGVISFEDNGDQFGNIVIMVIDPSKSDTLYISGTNDYSEKYSIKLKRGSYKIVCQALGYFEKIENVNLSGDPGIKEKSLDFILKPVVKIIANVKTNEDKKTTGFVVKNIYFDYEDYHLKKDAKNELDRIIDFMKQQPQLSLTITGYTDSKGSIAINNYYSRKRSNAAYKYMLSNGITQSRITIKNVAKSDYIAINENNDGTDNPRGRQYNRRVEFSFNNIDNKLKISYSNDVPEDILMKKK